MKVFDIFFIYKIIERTFNGRQGVIHPIISGNNYSKRVIIRYDVSVNKFHKPELCMINRLIFNAVYPQGEIRSGRWKNYKF